LCIIALAPEVISRVSCGTVKWISAHWDAKLKLIALVETILARAEPAAKRRINGSRRSVADAS
jgi:hypothetical protein